MERPSRAKKNYWPAQVVIEHTIQRRTPNQVKVYQEKAKKDIAAAKAAAIAHKQSQLDQVASLEDAMQARNNACSLENLHPDLHIDHKSGSISDVDTLSDSHLVLKEPIEIPCLPSIKIPCPLLPLSQLKKQTNPPPPVDGYTSAKQIKTSEPGGLVCNWVHNVDALSYVAKKNPIC